MSFLFHLSLLSGDYDPLLSLRLGSRVTHWLCPGLAALARRIGCVVASCSRFPSLDLVSFCGTNHQKSRYRSIPTLWKKKITSPM
jgi:hypothetical protein